MESIIFTFAFILVAMVTNYLEFYFPFVAFLTTEIFVIYFIMATAAIVSTPWIPMVRVSNSLHFMPLLGFCEPLPQNCSFLVCII